MPEPSEHHMKVRVARVTGGGGFGFSTHHTVLEVYCEACDTLDRVEGRILTRALETCPDAPRFLAKLNEKEQ